MQCRQVLSRYLSEYFLICNIQATILQQYQEGLNIYWMCAVTKTDVLILVFYFSSSVPLVGLTILKLAYNKRAAFVIYLRQLVTCHHIIIGGILGLTRLGRH